MEFLSPNLAVSNANATGSGRNKTALKPGHSLMDWIRLTNSGKDLTSTGGKVLEVSTRELAKHNTRKDAWIALKGRVYNITPYLDFHPGGEEELMRGAGKDATDLFNEVHRWVNAESMLQKCFVGVLKKSWSLDGSKFSSVKPLKKLRNPKISTKKISSSEKENLVPNEKSEWYIVSASSEMKGEIFIRANQNGIKTEVKVTSSKVKLEELITDLVNENLYVKLNKESNKWLNIKFPNSLEDNYEVQFTKSKTDNDTIELTFDNSKDFAASPRTDILWTLCDRNESIFWPCKLVDKVAVNYNTYLFTFTLPPNVKMWIPIGCHVYVKSTVEGMEVMRSYTPVVPSLDISKGDNISCNSHIILLIKIYPSGTLTPLLNLCNTGESVLISDYVGTFSEVSLMKSDSIVMLAAGTGITPMIRVIYWALTKEKKRTLSLLFFNKTEKDILWRDQLEKCSENFENFTITHILSESDDNWHGRSGRISADILNEYLKPNISENLLVLICGPTPFTNSALRLLEKYGHENVYAFTG